MNKNEGKKCFNLDDENLFLEELNSELLNVSNYKARAFLLSPKSLQASVIARFKNDVIWGIHPSLSVDQVSEKIKSENSPFSEVTAFRKWVGTYISKCNWPESISKTPMLGEALLARALLVCSHQYYYETKMPDEIFTIFMKSGIVMECLEENSALRVRIYGRMTDDQIVQLEREGIIFSTESNIIWFNKKGSLLEQKKEITKWRPISSFYTATTDQINRVADFFYSGVNMLLYRIEEEEQTANHLTVYKLIIGQTTYLTRLGCGNSQLLKKKYDPLLGLNTIGNKKCAGIDLHPLLQPYSDLLRIYDEQEVCLQDELFARLWKESRKIEIINEYLSKTAQFTTISIAGNIKTSDGYYIVAHRGDNVESPDTFSCSVNGVAEVYHIDVSLYNNSALQDRPRILYTNETVRFDDEFNREMTAELGIPDQINWDYVGVGLFDLPSMANELKRNALVFDVIGFTQVMHSLDRIAEFRKRAVEEKENKKIYGYSIYCHRNLLGKWRHKTKHAIEGILAMKQVILTLFVAVPYIVDGFWQQASIDLSIAGTGNPFQPLKAIQDFFAFLLIIMLVLQWDEKRKARSNKVNIEIDAFVENSVKSFNITKHLLSRYHVWFKRVFRSSGNKSSLMKCNILFVLLTRLTLQLNIQCCNKSERDN